MSLPSITGENRPRELLFIQGFVSLTVLDDEDSPIEVPNADGGCLHNVVLYNGDV